MSDNTQENWIWGLHSLEACAEVYPEWLLEVFVERAASVKAKSLLDKLSGMNVSLVEKLPRFLAERRTQGVAAKIKRFPVFPEEAFFESEIPDVSQVLVLDRIQDPQNFGAILRSAAALGVSAVIVGRREQCPVNGTVALVSAGNLFRLKIYTAANLAKTCEHLAEMAFSVWALDGGGKDLTKIGMTPRIAWVLGAEEDGISGAVLKVAHEKVGIPMAPGVESLNVSNSAAIALYEASKKLKNM